MLRPAPSIAVLLTTLFLAAGAVAQDPDIARQERETSDQLERPTGGGVVARVQRPDGTLDLPEDATRPPRPTLVPEGAVLINRRGIIVPITGARWAFVFDPDETGHRDDPMFLQPCLRLAEMISLAEARERTVTFLVTGDVFVYRGQNHLLPTRFTTVAYADEDGDGRSSLRDATRRAYDSLAEPPDQPRDPNEPTSEPPSVDDLLRQVEEATSAAESVRQTSRPRSGGDEVRTVMAESSLIVSRTGRLVIGSAGMWEFMMDNGASDPPSSSAGMNDEPIRILPSLNLERMEERARRYGDRAQFIVSGTVTIFEERNYLIPTIYTIKLDRAGNLVPGH